MATMDKPTEWLMNVCAGSLFNPAKVSIEKLSKSFLEEENRGPINEFIIEPLQKVLIIMTPVLPPSLSPLCI